MRENARKGVSICRSTAKGTGTNNVLMTDCSNISTEAAQTIVCAASSSYWWVTPCIIALSAIVAGVFSWLSIKSSRDVARKRATLDLIERSESTQYYQEVYVAFTEVRKDGDCFNQIRNPTNPELIKQRQKVINYLNHYELIALGISQGILDETVYKMYMRSTVVRDWFAAEAFIRHIRNPTTDSGSEVSAGAAFSNFEALATKWRGEVELNISTGCDEQPETNNPSAQPL